MVAAELPDVFVAVRPCYTSEIRSPLALESTILRSAIPASSVLQDADSGDVSESQPEFWL